jgi:hypothetical protein
VSPNHRGASGRCRRWDGGETASGSDRTRNRCG